MALRRRSEQQLVARSASRGDGRAREGGREGYPNDLNI